MVLLLLSIEKIPTYIFESASQLKALTLITDLQFQMKHFLTCLKRLSFMERIEHDMEENDQISKFVVLCYNAFKEQTKQ